MGCLTDADDCDIPETSGSDLVSLFNDLGFVNLIDDAAISRSRYKVQSLAMSSRTNGHLQSSFDYRSITFHYTLKVRREINELMEESQNS